MKIAVTGASGFIGKNLVEHLLQHTNHQIVALSRRSYQSNSPRIETRQANLYSLLDCEEALKDCDIGVYLVHSMSPSSRLSQGNFQDFDFILADNFAKAAVKNKLKHILYISGIIPDKDKLSAHLESRLEVERTFNSHETPVTTLRCGLVVGKNGSSFNIVEKLIERLPIMGLPKWTKTKLQVVYVKDLVAIMTKVIDNHSHQTFSYDVGAPEYLQYQDILTKVSRVKGGKNYFIPIRFISPGLSKLWVRLITQLPGGLIYPLVDSLKHQMTVNPEKMLPEHLEVSYTLIDTAIEQSVNSDSDPSLPVTRTKENSSSLSLVQSVQRLPCPKNWSMERVAKYYTTWVPQFLWPFFVIIREKENLDFYTKFLSQPILRLTFSKERTFKGRELFYITGGLLNRSHPKARMEFREGPNKNFLIVAIHSFRPRLPWLIYKYSQAQLHRFVMWRFGVNLSKVPESVASTSSLDSL